MNTIPAANTHELSLAGSWQLAPDPGDTGLAGRWFAQALANARPVQLPGSLAVQRIGDDVTKDTTWTGTIFDRSFYESPEYAPYREPGQVKIPFFLQPDKVFTGPAWYQREIEIPATWSGRFIILSLERPHWLTTVWLDETELGSGDSLATAHEFALGAAGTPGRHRLTLRIDNRLLIPVGENAHSVSDQTQGNWNGCIGRMELRTTAPVWIDDVQVTPRVSTRSITVRGSVVAPGWNPSSGRVVGRAPGKTGPEDRFHPRLPVAGQMVTLSVGGDTVFVEVMADGTFTAELGLGPHAGLWDEFTPNLHTLTVTLENGETRDIRFGLREITTQGRQVLLNDRPVFFRGTLDCCIFPLTGHPPMDVETWRQYLRTLQGYGINHIRFHSWCPPEAAFIAGDELGIYFQIEAGVWPNAIAVLAADSPAGLGDGASVDAWLLAESRRIVRAYGNHPCFMLMAAGNEPGGPQHKTYLARWLTEMQATDSRRLYTGTAGWPELPENQFHIIPAPRGHQWGDGLKSRLNAQPPATTTDYREIIAQRSRPVISHEIGQWTAYPALHDAPKYTGHLKPRCYEIIVDTLAAHHLADQLDDFVQASGKLQALCYKEEIESALRTPGMGGFQLLNLQDFPGQGTAPVGVINALGEAKAYIAAADFRRFCGPIVPLARLARRVFTTDESLEADVEVAWAGPEGRSIAVASWALVNDAGHTLLGGQLPPQPVAAGESNPLGHVTIPFRHVPAPCRYKLVVRLDGTALANDWDVWVYPSTVAAEPADKIIIASSLAAARPALAAGASVLLLVSPAKWNPSSERVVQGAPEPTGPEDRFHPEKVALGFTPIFWNTSCTQRQAPHTLGILCDPAHPALAAFPTDSHTNWQWWHLVTRAAAMNLDALPPTLRPLVQVIDDWATNRRLGLVFEARVGPGRLLVCSIDLTGDLSAQPVARQLRASLLAYVGSARFNPSESVSLEALQTVLAG